MATTVSVVLKSPYARNLEPPLFTRGCARTYAEFLGDKEGAEILQTTLNEEGDSDKKLTKLAMTVINIAADK